MKRTRTRVIVAALLAAACLGGLAVAGQTVSSKKSGPFVYVPLTDAEKAEMLFIWQEEKLARDVYIAMYGLWQDPIFLTIAASEQKHMDAVWKLITEKYIDEAEWLPLTALGYGEYGQTVHHDLNALYAELAAKGAQTLWNALDVGRTIEELDIEDLKQSIQVTLSAWPNGEHADIVTVYTNIMTGSTHHLAAFLARLAEL